MKHSPDHHANQMTPQAQNIQVGKHKEADAAPRGKPMVHHAMHSRVNTGGMGHASKSGVKKKRAVNY